MLVLCAVAPAGVRAQSPAAEGGHEDESGASGASAVVVDREQAAGDGSPGGASASHVSPASALGSPALPAQPGWGDPNGPPPVSGPPPSQRPTHPRGWRFPRQTVRRPLTLPQGVLRFDSTVALESYGGRASMIGYAGVAAGLFDDLEIGATPFGLTFLPPFALSDPYVYARVRVISGNVQLAVRAGSTLPVANQLSGPQMTLAGELAWLIAPVFRIDTGLEYGALFGSTFYQRVGVPLTATLQLGIQALALVSGVYVYNDFDDADVPLQLRYTVTFRGYQGPLGEFSMQGGFTDFSTADSSWMVQTRLTFFAYL